MRLAKPATGPQKCPVTMSHPGLLTPWVGGSFLLSKKIAEFLPSSSLELGVGAGGTSTAMRRNGSKEVIYLEWKRMPEQRHSIPVSRPLTTHLLHLHGAANSSFTVVNIFLLTSSHWDSETSSLQQNYTVATCCCNWFLPQRQERQQSPGGLPGFGQFTDIPPHPHCPHSQLPATHDHQGLPPEGQGLVPQPLR